MIQSVRVADANRTPSGCLGGNGFRFSCVKGVIVFRVFPITALAHSFPLADLKRLATSCGEKR